MDKTSKQPETEQPRVYEELVITPMRAESATDAITQLGARLQVGGFVKDSWTQATLERERTFATGLPIPEMGVAIPHTDAIHVLKPAIAVGVPDEPVEFGEMGSLDGQVPVRIICTLAMVRSESLATLLQRLIGMFQSPGVLTQIAGAQNPADIVAIFDQHLLSAPFE